MQESDLDLEGDSYLPAWFDTDVVTAPIDKPRKPSAPRQSKAVRTSILDQAEAALGSLTDAEIKAGSTARAEIDNARRFNAVAGIKRDRERVTKICAGQRAGLVRVLRVMEGGETSFDLDNHVRRIVDDVLDLSANMAVLSDCDWSKTRRWLEKVLPVIAMNEMVWLESRFRIHLRAAEAEMARRIPIKLADHRTAPSPREIAERHQITTVILREAGANKCGLTSIDPEQKTERDRRGAEQRRRARGQKLRSDCTKDADFQKLAKDLNCHVSTIWRHDTKGDLGTWIVKRRAKLGL